MLTVKNLCKSFGKKNVLDNISLTCENTGTTALMGASGIGKTALLNIIAGLEKPDAGGLFCDFVRISYQFQAPRLFPWLTALENVKAALSNNKNADDISLYWLSRVGLSDSIDKFPSQLSGGMMQRCALARALAYGGDLLMLDEPFSAVDIQTRDILVAVVSEYAQEHAVLLVTHDQVVAEQLKANIICLK